MLAIHRSSYSSVRCNAAEGGGGGIWASLDRATSCQTVRTREVRHLQTSASTLECERDAGLDHEDDRQSKQTGDVPAPACDKKQLVTEKEEQRNFQPLRAGLERVQEGR